MSVRGADVFYYRTEQGRFSLCAKLQALPSYLALRQESSINLVNKLFISLPVHSVINIVVTILHHLPGKQSLSLPSTAGKNVLFV